MILRFSEIKDLASIVRLSTCIVRDPLFGPCPVMVTFFTGLLVLNPIEKSISLFIDLRLVDMFLLLFILYK